MALKRKPGKRPTKKQRTIDKPSTGKPNRGRFRRKNTNGKAGEPYVRKIVKRKRPARKKRPPPAPPRSRKRRQPVARQR